MSNATRRAKTVAPRPRKPRAGARTAKPNPKRPVGPQINSAMTIEEITSALAAGSMSEQDANAQLHAIVDDQATKEADKTRNAFAASALNGMLAKGERKPSMDEAARECFQYADAMVAASKGELPEPQVARAQPEPIPRFYGPSTNTGDIGY